MTDRLQAVTKNRPESAGRAWPSDMRWILHIGAPKTGSTAIQRFFFDNREIMLDHGVHYPDVSIRGYGHHDLAFLLNGRYADWATPQTRSLDDLRIVLRDAVRSSPAATTVLSSEIFYMYPAPAALHRLLKDAGFGAGDEVVVLCYLRRQDEAHVSWYNQTVKAQGNSLGFQATSRRDHDLWRYDMQLRPWQDEFGSRNILVRDYTPFARSSHDVRRDVLDIIGVPHDAFDFPSVRINDRINRDILEFQRWINRLPLAPRQKRRYHKRLIELTKATAGGGLFSDAPFLSADARKALLASYADGNASLARAYLGRSMLFDPVVDEPAGPSRQAVMEGLTVAKILRILAWLALGRGPATPNR